MVWRGLAWSHWNHGCAPLGAPSNGAGPTAAVDDRGGFKYSRATRLPPHASDPHRYDSLLRTGHARGFLAAQRRLLPEAAIPGLNA